MRRLIISLIKFYQTFLSSALRQLLGAPHMCRYYPICSEFAIIQIQKYGIQKGGQKAIARLLTCHPFAK